ncbi:hypothetical protein MSG28_003933 [Choristoneura fumiferana]|uniref:Uncharacterized protein n=1 Tax=Choristoneura fumiferana TaxID=7141 RepID=A0ACC0KGX3_CHOFU|nr:hypothetical protein MSG28_003933 [Choristoneura fumiferana]
MQKIKRKAGDTDTPAPKKKKVQFTEVVKAKKSDVTDEKKPKKPNITNGKKNFKNVPKKDFTKAKPGTANKKFNQFDKSKGKFSKGKTFGKDKGGNQTNGEKPQWSEMKKEKKQLRIVRRKAKTSAEVFEIANKAKLLAAQIQRKVVKPDFKKSSCKELHLLLKGQYKSIALTHDLSRVIQVLLKHGEEDIRNEITEELLDLMVPMVQSKYGQHAVKRILKYGSDAIRHKTKDDKVKTLTDTYKDSPEMKTAILQSCKANIQRILDKNLHDGELLHSVLYDYIRACSLEERVELVSTLGPLIVPLSNSLPGANTASICVWQGSNKDKKAILKVVKEHAVALAKHKTGYRLLLTIFDSVDDTVLVRKAIVSSLQANFRELAKDHWGNMTLHWLVKPKDPAAFHPSLIKFLDEGFKSGTSKKDAELRVTELREAILPTLAQDIAADPQFWISDKSVMLLAVAVVAVDSNEEIVKALAQAICRPDWTISRDDKALLAIEDAGIHMCLKKQLMVMIQVWLPTNRGCFFLLKLIESNSDKVANKLRKKIKPHTDLLKQQKTEGAKLLLQNVQKK